AGYLTSAFWGSFMIGRLLAVPLAARLRPHAILLTDLIGCLFSIGTILLWSNAQAGLWLGTFGMGLSMASIFPTMLSLAARHMTMTGRVTGRFLVGAGAGAMTVPWLIGQLFEPIGPHVTMVIILLDLVMATIIFALLTQYWTPCALFRRR